MFIALSVSEKNRSFLADFFSPLFKVHEDLHITLIYTNILSSKDKLAIIDYLNQLETSTFAGYIYDYSIVLTHMNTRALILKVESNLINKLFEDLQSLTDCNIHQRGFDWEPHITLTYDLPVEINNQELRLRLEDLRTFALYTNKIIIKPFNSQEVYK